MTTIQADAAGLPAVISIDPPMSVDLDDAIAVTERADGGYVVDVCLPDVPSLVGPGSDEDVKARKAGFTRYGGSFIRQAMLDEKTVLRLSLSPGSPRPMIWIRLTMSPRLDVEAIEVRRILHRTAARITYLEADEALSDPSRPLHAAVSRLWSLAQRLYARRHAETGALFDTGGRLYTSEEGMLRMLGAKESHQSHLIVMEIMILTNSALAEHAGRNGIPILYRNHKPTDTSTGFRQSVAEELALVHAEGMEQAAERLKHLASRIGPASLGTTSEGHWGLDLRNYAWFTSPLRRYCDIVNLRAIVDGYQDADAAALAQELTTLYVAEKERTGALHAERSRRTITRHVQAGHESMLCEFDMHSILRACADAELPDDMIERELRRRMATNALSGKDMEYVFSYGRTLLHETVVRDVVDWMTADDAVQTRFAREMVQRQRLVRLSVLPDGTPATGVAIGQIAEICHFELPASYHERISRERTALTEGPKPTAAVEEPAREVAVVPHANPKGALFELAAVRKAKVAIEQNGRQGPAHKPWFTVTATWTHKGSSVEGRGEGPTLKHAEKAACFEVLTALETANQAEPAAGPVFDPTANPKSVLLEHAVGNAARVEIGRAVVSGPPHSPTFQVDAVYRKGRDETRGKGTGTTIKQAEREACGEILRALAS